MQKLDKKAEDGKMQFAESVPRALLNNDLLKISMVKWCSVLNQMELISALLSVVTVH